MKKTLLFAALGVLTGALKSQATSIAVIDFGNGTENAVTLNSGATLANGSIKVRVGYFNTAAQDANWLTNLKSTTISSINSALASFIPLGENSVNQPLLGTGAGTATGPRIANRVVNSVQKPGRLIGSVTDVNPTPGTPDTVNAGGVPVGSRIFMLVYSDGDAVLNNGEEFGVFSADNWKIDGDSTLTLSLNTTDINLASEVYRGTFGSLKLGPVGNIPEPATGALGLLAGLGMLARRRRK
ncbi:MAG TPA: PEP-CTERM sorting domain-containing protein [Verrucomicrobiales bacterium]|jgi:hypothetical protein|nr:PEP-CTERM sorting domain-containing protein [Verrucomicrobiales bacterium]